jgi:hypothetical protein
MTHILNALLIVLCGVALAMSSMLIMILAYAWPLSACAALALVGMGIAIGRVWQLEIDRADTPRLPAATTRQISRARRAQRMRLP